MSEDINKEKLAALRLSVELRLGHGVNTPSEFKRLSEDIKQQLGRSKNEMQRLPSKRLNLAEIEREQSVIEPLYVLLQKKREETMLAIIAEPDIARVVEYAENNSAFVGPNRRKTYLLALVLGLVFPIGIAYVLLLLKTKITTPDDISTRTNIPVIGIIPQSERRVTKASEIIHDSSTSTTTETTVPRRAPIACPTHI